VTVADTNINPVIAVGTACDRPDSAGLDGSLIEIVGSALPFFSPVIRCSVGDTDPVAGRRGFA
jgi:hypothetical protein